MPTRGPGGGRGIRRDRRGKIGTGWRNRRGASENYAVSGSIFVRNENSWIGMVFFELSLYHSNFSGLGRVSLGFAKWFMSSLNYVEPRKS